MKKGLMRIGSILLIFLSIFYKQEAMNNQEQKIDDYVIASALQDQIFDEHGRDDLTIALLFQSELNGEKIDSCKTERSATNSRPIQTYSGSNKKKEVLHHQQLNRARMPKRAVCKAAPKSSKSVRLNETSTVKPSNGTIGLPKELQDKNIIHLKVNKQGANQCGSHAALNARAIQILNFKNLPITAQAVQQQNSLFKKFIKPHQLTYDQVCQLSQEIGLERTVIIAYNNGLRKGRDGRQKIDRAVDGVQISRFYMSSNTPDINYISESLELFFVNIIDHLKMCEANDFHLICNTGGHWVSISVVQNAGKFTIYYCNSTNAPISSDSIVLKFVLFIYKMLSN